MKTYDDVSDFYEEADQAEYLIRDGGCNHWLFWAAEDGEWYGIRARTQDDGLWWVDDEYRPIGPVDLEFLEEPITVISVEEALTQR